MKAPDKIYLGIQDMGSGYVYKLSLDDNGEQEYIRKDTLPDDELVSNDLTKAAEHYAWMKEQPLSDGERLSICFNPRIEAYKAGAKWQRKQDELLSKITEEHLEGLRWIIRTGITTQPRPYHKYCKDLLQLLESYKNEI